MKKLYSTSAHYTAAELYDCTLATRPAWRAKCIVRDWPYMYSSSCAGFHTYTCRRGTEPKTAARSFNSKLPQQNHQSPPPPLLDDTSRRFPKMIFILYILFIYDYNYTSRHRRAAPAAAQMTVLALPYNIMLVFPFTSGRKHLLAVTTILYLRSRTSHNVNYIPVKEDHFLLHAFYTCSLHDLHAYLTAEDYFVKFTNLNVIINTRQSWSSVKHNIIYHQYDVCHAFFKIYLLNK